MFYSDDLVTLCRSTLEAISPLFRDKDIAAGFFPYLGLTHTIRRRGNSWVIRISDHCHGAPPAVLRSIVIQLACKILRRKPAAEAVQAYERFRRDPEIERRVRSRRLQRGRKQIVESPGKYHYLRDIYADLNRSFFNGQVDIRRVGWGARRSWSRLGHYDPVHHTITISPVLDSPKVPRLVVAYLLYHEMLHTLFDRDVTGVRKRHHTAEFYATERAFPDYRAARKFLDRFCRTRGSGSSTASHRGAHH